MNSRNRSVDFWITVTGITLLIIAVVTFVCNKSYMLHGKTANINKMLYDNNYKLDSMDLLDKDFASLTINSSLGSFATVKHKVNFITIGEDTLYLALLEDNTVLAVRIHDQDDIDMMEKITSETYASKDYYSKHTLTLEGKVTSFNSGELFDYYVQALDKLGINDDEKKESAGSGNETIRYRYICIDSSQNRGTLWAWTIISFLAGLIAIIGNKVLSYFLMQKRFKEQEQDAAVVKQINKNAGGVQYWSNSGERIDKEKNPEPTPAEKKEEEINIPIVEFDELDFFLSDGEYLGENTVMDPKMTEEEPKFNTPERHERTEADKISISGRNLIK